MRSVTLFLTLSVVNSDSLDVSTFSSAFFPQPTNIIVQQTTIVNISFLNDINNPSSNRTTPICIISLAYLYVPSQCPAYYFTI